MSILLVGFDSAWTAKNRGAIVGVLAHEDEKLQELGDPRAVNFEEAKRQIHKWKESSGAKSSVVLLDQPTIVNNPTGQRPVEQIVCPSVGRRKGGMQPANTGKTAMFGPDAPIWGFLSEFGGAAQFCTGACAGVVETYPVLAIIALGWTLGATNPECLPKYNPKRNSFEHGDWVRICSKVAEALSTFGLTRLSNLVCSWKERENPSKCDQDCLDACICLLVALWLAKGRPCFFVGNYRTGYIVVPDSPSLRLEFSETCRKRCLIPAEWIQELPKLKL